MRTLVFLPYANFDPSQPGYNPEIDDIMTALARQLKTEVDFLPEKTAIYYPNVPNAVPTAAIFEAEFGVKPVIAGPFGPNGTKPFYGGLNGFVRQQTVELCICIVSIECFQEFPGYFSMISGFRNPLKKNELPEGNALVMNIDRTSDGYQTTKEVRITALAEA